eukprot:8099485-Heterocapsa_arctica.AAC.1
MPPFRRSPPGLRSWRRLSRRSARPSTHSPNPLWRPPALQRWRTPRPSGHPRPALGGSARTPA